MHKHIISLVLSIAVASLVIVDQPNLPTVAASPKCPSQQSNSPTEFSLGLGVTSPLTLRRAILDYLNQGGPYTGLQWLIRKNTTGSILPVDLNRDGVEEIVVSTSIFNEAWGLASWISIYECADGLYRASEFDLEASYIQSIRVVRVIDLMALGYPQAYFHYRATTSACTESVIIIGWNGNAFVDFGQLPYVYCPASVKVFDYNQDGQREIYMRGMTAGNLESGVGRGVVRVYKWGTNAFQEVETTYLPSPYRIHVLQDAQEAFNNGDIRKVLALYEKAATRSYLINERSVYENETGQDFAGQYQTAFANFRLVTLWVSENGLHTAQSIVTRMQAKYPTSTPGSEFVELALIFKAEFARTHNRSSACAAVTTRVNESYPNLAGYGYIGNWGTANVEYNSENLCPFP